MRKPLVSIIIPIYNRSLLIGETLDSILIQSYPHWECLVIDDGSTDHTEDVVRNYCEKDERFQFYKRPQDRPKGGNACRNYGLEICKGDYVNWFDSDDLMHPDKLKLQVMVLEHSDAPFSVCQSLVFEDQIENTIGLRSETLISNHVFDDFLKKRIIWLTQAPLFKKSIFKDNHFRFDETLQAGQEWELFTRLLFDYKNYHVIEQPLVYIRRHSDSISGKEISSHQTWNYFLARLKIYHHFKNRLTLDNTVYLKRYFLLSYKILVRNKAFIKAFRVWKLALYPDRYYHFNQHIRLLMALVSFKLFGKGDLFLTKVDRWDDH